MMKLQLLFWVVGTASSFVVPSPNLLLRSPISHLFSQQQVEEEDHVAENDRRSFLVTGLSTVATVSMWGPFPAFADGAVDYKAVSNDIAALVKDDPDKGTSTDYMILV